MNPQAATITAGLIEQLNGVWETELDRAEVLRDLEAQALKLRSAHIGEGDMVLGMVYCLMGDEARMRKAHTNSINWLGRDSFVLENFALSLKRLGYYTEALNLAVRAFDNFGSVRALEVMIQLAELLGLHTAAKRYRELWSTIVPEGENTVLLFYDQFPSIRPAVSTSLERSVEEHAGVWAELAKR